MNLETHKRLIDEIAALTKDLKDAKEQNNRLTEQISRLQHAVDTFRKCREAQSAYFSSASGSAERARWLNQSKALERLSDKIFKSFEETPQQQLF